MYLHSKRNKVSIALLIILILVTNSVYAHPGRTDSQGGHYVRTPGWGYPVGSYGSATLN